MIAEIENQLKDFAKKELQTEGLTFEFVKDLGGAFSNKLKRIKLPLYDEIDEEKMDVLKCLLTHEVCHLDFSDFDYEFDEKTPGLLLPSLIIEDIVVERNMVEKNAHVCGYLKKLNNNYVYKYFIKNKDYSSMNVDDLCLRKFFTMFSRTDHCPMTIIRYAVSNDKKEKAQEKFEKLRKFIPEAFNLETRPRTTKTSEDLARKVLEFFGDFEKPSYYFGK